ncbi:MAG: hypothetical protein R6V62_11600 [Candidatus Fermentibacteraceae bacterium]
MLIAASLLLASSDAPGLNSINSATDNPLLAKPWRPGRSFLDFSNSLASLRAVAVSQNSRVSLGSNPQKPLLYSCFCSDLSFTAYPVEPVQSPTVTLYTF